jgi:hypothetical protein
MHVGERASRERMDPASIYPTVSPNWGIFVKPLPDLKCGVMIDSRLVKGFGRFRPATSDMRSGNPAAPMDVREFQGT